MLKNTLIIALIVLVIYLYYQQRQKLNLLKESKIDSGFQNFLQTNLNSNSLEELKTKLDSKTLDEILEENNDYETEVDTLTRTKNSLEADLLVQSNAFQSRLKEKDREVKKLKEDLASEQKRLQKSQEQLSSEKQQGKGSVERIKLLTEQITNLEKQQAELTRSQSPIPGSFPEGDKSELVQTHQAQLRKINTLFDEQAKDYPEIDFKGLYSLLEQKKKELEKK